VLRSATSTLVLSADNSTLAILAGPGSDKLLTWKWKTAAELRELVTAWKGRVGAQFSPDGKILAEIADDDSSVYLLDSTSGKLLHKLVLPDKERYRHRCAAFSPDGKVVAVSGVTATLRSTAIHVWDVATGKFRHRVSGCGLKPAAFSPDGTLPVSGTHVWDFAAGKDLSANDKTHRGTIERLATGPDNLVVTASDDHTVRIWNAATASTKIV
jgi:WD40 repeat protein